MDMDMDINDPKGKKKISKYQYGPTKQAKNLTFNILGDNPFEKFSTYCNRKSKGSSGLEGHSFLGEPGQWEI